MTTADRRSNGRELTRFWGTVVAGVAAGLGAVGLFAHPHHVTVDSSLSPDVGICGAQVRAAFPLTVVSNSDTSDIQVRAVTAGAGSTNTHVEDFVLVDAGSATTQNPHPSTPLIQGAPRLPAVSRTHDTKAGRNAALDVLVAVDPHRPAEMHGLDILVQDGAGTPLHLTDTSAKVSFPATCQTAP